MSTLGKQEAIKIYTSITAGLLYLRPPYEGRYKMMGGVCLSVCPSVARLDLTRERKDMEEPKIARMEAHHTGNVWTHLEVKRLKVKVTRPINAVTDNAPYAGRDITIFLKLVCFIRL